MRAHTELEEKIVGCVERHGSFIMSVSDPDGDSAPYSYSIGFEKTAGQPDVIILGLTTDMRVDMIGEILRQMREDGLILADGAEIDNLLVDYRCIARDITARSAIADHMGSAIWYYQSQMDTDLTRAFQIVWPCAKEGLFPWDEGCARNVIQNQPALYAMKDAQ